MFSEELTEKKTATYVHSSILAFETTNLYL